MQIYFEKPYAKLKTSKPYFMQKPQDIWEQTTLPIGNGTLGLSAMGGIQKEILVVNCKTLWTGGPAPTRPDYNGGNITEPDKNGKTRLDYYKEVREAFAAGRDEDGAALCEKLVGKKEGYGAYQCGGQIEIVFHDHIFTPACAYRRTLDLDHAILETKISRGRPTKSVCEATRTYFVSYPARAAVLRFARTETPFGCTVAYPSHHDAIVTADESGITHTGTLTDNALHFSARLEAETDGTCTPVGDTLCVTDATYLNLYFAMDTDYQDNYPIYRTGESAAQLHTRVCTTAKSARKIGYFALRKAHIQDYQSLFNRLSFSLGAHENLPTDKLLHAYHRANCPAKIRRTLETLLFEYGRYLLIASSRETDSLPANLQGIWNCSNSPIWSSDYHLNINLQMNYWPAFSANLAECATPLLRYVQALCAPGRVTAQVYTGAKPGFLFHTQNTPFGWTCPGWDFSWGWSPVAVAWILHNVYEQFTFTRDTAVLRKQIYPLLQESADYFISQLMEKDGRLVTCPCFSPEHGPRTAGNTYEQALVWQLLTDTLQAAQVLGIANENTLRYAEVIQRLHPVEIGESGQIKEWYHETTLASIGQRHHRHLSHLLWLYPGNYTDQENTEKLLAAAKISLEDRGDKSTGWAIAQRICARARTGEGDRALRLIGMLMQHGVSTNLWGVHPPFQIDANFGYTAAVAELLLQSHAGFLSLLPALPTDWAQGEIRGICARGGFSCDLFWEKGVLQRAEILSNAAEPCRVCTPGGKLCFAEGDTPNTYDEDGCLVFPTERGKRYVLTLSNHT